MAAMGEVSDSALKAATRYAPVRPDPAAVAAAEEADATAAAAAKVAATSAAARWTPRTVQRSTLHSSVVVLPDGRGELSLDLTLGESQIEPMFSGGAWAGSVIWSAALLLCDCLAADAALVEGNPVYSCIVALLE